MSHSVDRSHPALPPNPDQPTRFAPSPLEQTTSDTPGSTRTATAAPRLADPAPPGDAKVGWPRPASGRIGMYELIEELRPGGMARVFKARHVQLQHVVALKVMHADNRPDADYVRRFQREAQAVANLHHPNIVAIQEYSAGTNPRFFTMPFMPRGSLDRQIYEYCNDPRRAVALLVKIARAVEYAHGRGVLHRDLKPGNILLDERGEPHVSDFGLAKLPDGGEAITLDGQVMGTAAYMPPEQAAGKVSELSPACDVWSLGVILFELLSGQRPFSGRDSEELLRKVLTSEAPQLRSVKASVPPALAAIVGKCLEREPKRRYGSVGALADDLERWQRGEAPSVRPDAWLARLLRRLRRSPATTALTMVAVLGASTGLILSYQKDQPLRQWQRTLAAGHPVTLVGETGVPSWYRWIRGEKESTWKLESDGSFTVQTWSMALLELLPDPQNDHYRFSASVRQRSGDEGGHAGIYFAYDQHRVAEERGACFLRLSFNDAKDDRVRHTWLQQLPGIPKAPPPPGNQVWFEGHVLYGLDGEAPAQASFAKANKTQFFVAAGADTSWRRLGVDVSPSKVVGSWEEASFAETPFAAAAAGLEEWRQQQTAGSTAQVPALASQLRFLPRGSLGLLVVKGCASFKHVSVEPQRSDR